MITGCAGFIGYHLSKTLLDNNYEVLGIDNVNDYYDINLKNARIEQLSLFDNFKFDKIDISKIKAGQTQVLERTIDKY